MSYLLYPSSGNHVVLEPNWDFDNKRSKVQDEHLTRNGKRFVYTWGVYDKFSFGVEYVNSSTTAIINSWWQSDTKLLFQENVAGAKTYSVMLTGKEMPIGNFVKPYTNLFKGKIDLQGY